MVDFIHFWSGRGIFVQQPLRVEVLFGRTTFDEIINDYDDLEKQVHAAAFRGFADALTGSEYTSGEVAIKGEPYFIEYDVSGAASALTIRMRSVESSKSEPVIVEHKLGEAGTVKRIVVRCNKKTAAAAERALHRAATIMASSYRLLERRLLDQYRDFHKGLFIGIEPIIFSCFDQHHLPEFAQECLLSITPLARSKYSFYLGPEQARRILAEFKKLNLDEGALELLITLLVEEGGDSFIGRNILRDDQFTALAFSELWDMNGNPRLVRAESILTQGRTIACLELCRVDGISLQANIAARFADRAQAPLLSVRQELTEQFARNLQLAGWRRRNLGLSWNARRARRKNLMASALEFAQGVIAKVIVEGAKPPGT